MMTREEAITRTEEVIKFLKDQGWDVFHQTSLDILALKMALSALRPISREWVEKVWKGEWKKDSSVQVLSPGGQKYHFRCSKCGYITRLHDLNFCSKCGAPMTDEAVEMVMEKLKKVIE